VLTKTPILSLITFMAWIIIPTSQSSLAIFSIILRLLKNEKERIKINNEKSTNPAYYKVSAKIGNQWHAVEVGGENRGFE
jgi:hypothetical protein